MNQFRLNEWEVIVQQSFTTLYTEVWLRHPTEDGMVYLTPEMKHQKMIYGDPPPKPTFQMPSDVVRAFFQSLWDTGMRPRDRRYEAEADLLRGQLDIQGKHLEDMRSLVFQKPEKKP